ncbi:MAG: SLC13 family permease, partial [Alphaproteobacteria bacterium]|nr:SLC13 family permease [Alphaproteobacteria bacterium]
MSSELIPLAETSFQMWAVFVLITVALYIFATDKLSIEITSLSIICLMMIFFSLFPMLDDHGKNLMGVKRILNGFANSALLTVLALLVVGQGMVRTGVLEFGAQFVLKIGRGHLLLTLLMVLVIVTSTSAFLNNIPVVVIFIPIMQTMAAKMGRPASKFMMPLSFAAVLGGMTTLIGSGTNLLVSSAMIELGLDPLGFFEFTIPGLVMAGAGLAYIIFVAPLLLPSREGEEATNGGTGKQFIAEILVSKTSPLVGEEALGGIFKALPNITVRSIQRNNGETILPPFEDYVVEPRDVLIVAATRKVFYEALTKTPGMLTEEVPDIIDPETGKQKPWKEGEHMIAEVMVTPASRMIGQTLNQIEFHYRTHCLVAGVQRRSRMARSRMTDIRLAAGDVLLVQGHPKDANA